MSLLAWSAGNDYVQAGRVLDLSQLSLKPSGPMAPYEEELGGSLELDRR